MKILITGAKGFVGHSLIQKLSKEGHEIWALVRSMKNIERSNDSVKWIEGDLLHPESLPQLHQIEKAFYLIHGLKENADSFEYHESMAAVNFINWVRPMGSTIIYLGALGPHDEHLSSHLRSRHLTGAILGASGIPTLEFRASIVLGAGSLSFEMVKALTERLPFRPELSLLTKPCQPISISDLLHYLDAGLTHQPSGHRIYEIGGPDILSYGELMDLYAEVAGIKRKKLKLPEVESKVLMKVLDYALPEYAHAGKKLTQSLEFPTVVNHPEALKDFPEIRPDHIRHSMSVAEKASTSIYSPLWDKDFLRSLLSDKLLTQSGLLSPDLMRNLEKMGKLRDIFLKK